jgi:site-specific DNA recombinase
MEKILAGYIRVSTEMQAERDSLINQEEIIKGFAESKNKEYRIYKDAGISAKDKDRPAFQEMLKDIKQGLIEAVVVTKLDRITRSLKDLIFLKEFFEEHGISFISITQALDTSTPMGRFSFYILGLVAELEREMTAERVAEDMKGRAKRKKWNGGVVPFGFTSQIRHYRDWLKNKANEKIRESKGQSLKEIIRSLEESPKIKQEAMAFARQMMPEPKILSIDLKEAETVKTIYELYLKFRSFRNVVHSLNSLGIKTREGQPWASTSIHRILQNPIYYGALVYNKRRSSGKTSKPRPKEEHIIVEEVFDPIIPKEQFLEVQKIIGDQRKIPSYSKHSQYLLTGLLECQLCGTKMYGYTQKDTRKEARIYQYYRCNGHISKGSAFCTGNTVDAKRIEEIIIKELKSFSTDPKKLNEKAEDLKIRFDQEVKPLLDQQRAIQIALGKVEKRSQRLLGLYEDELIEKEEFAKGKSSLDLERRFLGKELEELNQKIFSNNLANFDLETTLSTIHNVGEGFEELDLRERKDLLRTVINKIEVGEHQLDCRIFAQPKSFVAYNHMVRDSWPPLA